MQKEKLKDQEAELISLWTCLNVPTEYSATDSTDSASDTFSSLLDDLLSNSQSTNEAISPSCDNVNLLHFDNPTTITNL